MLSAPPGLLVAAAAGAAAGALGAWRGAGWLAAARQREVRLCRQRLESVLANIPDSVVLCNMSGEVWHLNAAAVATLGLRGDDPIASANAPDFRAKIQRILKSRTTAETIELPGRQGGGRATTAFRVNVSLLRAPGEEDSGIMILLRDTTSEHSLDALKDDFFKAVADDLRAPLSAMQGYLNLLDKSLPPDRHQKGYLDAIMQSCGTLALLVQDRLDSARIESGEMKLAAIPVDPAGLVRRAVELFKPSADEKGVALSLQVGASLPPLVDLDDRLMERVLRHLLSNALRATPRCGAVTMSLASAGPREIDFAVCDEGPGLSAEQRVHVFEKFRPSGPPGPRPDFGLGLSLCRKIVVMHGGSIWVDSRPGKGSEFIVRIPIKQQPQGEKHAALKNG